MKKMKAKTFASCFYILQLLDKMMWKKIFRKTGIILPVIRIKK